MAELVQADAGTGQSGGETGSGVFTIRELRRAGGELVEGGAVFQWTASAAPPDPVAGGSRACPIKPWRLGLMIQKTRTDYPGATVPSVQVMGPRRKPFTLSGTFRDRYNFRGFAVKEMRRLEELASRGAICRFQYQAQVLEGMIDDLDFDYFADFEIGYSFTVDVFHRPDEGKIVQLLRKVVRSPLQAYNEASLAVDAVLEAHGGAPRAALGTDVAELADDQALALLAARGELSATLDQREGAPQAAPADVFRRISTQFRRLAAGAAGILDALYEVRSDLDVATLTPMAVIDFEVWSRTMRENARLLMLGSQTGAIEVQEHTAPYALALYRPMAGESLYSISQRYYGTPHAWRAIADRNNLRIFVLTGEELLIIPERSEG